MSGGAESVQSTATGLRKGGWPSCSSYHDSRRLDWSGMSGCKSCSVVAPNPLGLSAWLGLAWLGLGILGCNGQVVTVPPHLGGGDWVLHEVGGVGWEDGGRGTASVS